MMRPVPAADARRQIAAGVRCADCLRLLAVGAPCDCPALSATATLDRILRHVEWLRVDADNLAAALTHRLPEGEDDLWAFEALCHAMCLCPSCIAASVIEEGSLFLWDLKSRRVTAATSYRASAVGLHYFVSVAGIGLLAEHSRAPLGLAYDGAVARIGENLRTHGTADEPVAVVRGIPIVKTPEGALRIAREADEVRSRLAGDEGEP